MHWCKLPKQVEIIKQDTIQNMNDNSMFLQAVFCTQYEQK